MGQTEKCLLGIGVLPILGQNFLEINPFCNLILTAASFILVQYPLDSASKRATI